jgi:MFS family permease
MIGTFFFISQYMETNLHFDAMQAGLGFLPLTALLFLGSRTGPRILARFGARPPLVFGLITLVAASICISQASPSDGCFSSLLGPLLLLGLGAGQCFLPLSVTILAGVPREDAGAASGMLQTMQQTGASLGVAAPDIYAGSRTWPKPHWHWAESKFRSSRCDPIVGFVADLTALGFSTT